MAFSAGLRVKLAEWKIKSYPHFYYEMIENSVERGESNHRYTESNTHTLVNIRKDFQNRFLFHLKVGSDGERSLIVVQKV